ncbi:MULTISPECIES: type IV secretory system conjugative DNA transfer family protein [unclassified Microcoleus]|uniref:type IV secretory system conjugative DNA transfer family protein n=1 Tax=unclassified Microcoleus TaxID=2642155 RepID=UPI002FD14FBC
MLENKNQAIVSGLLAISITGFVGATALQFNDRIEYRIGNRIESNPAWLVPPKAEFKGLERGYGGIKITLALLATGASIAMMLLARKEGELEPMRQRIKAYKKQALEFNHAAEAAYQMAGTQMRYKKLAQAEEQAFEDELETAYCESLGINPHEQQAMLTGTTTLASVANPSDKVEATTTSAIEPDRTTGPQIPQLTWYPSVLVYGAPGSGKTFFSEEEVQKRLAAGHKVIVLDPHAAYGAWQGCEVIGGGMNYEAIDAKLAWFTSEIKQRYERVQNEPNPTFQPLTFVCDEFTHWGSKCENSAAFFEEIVTDIRKVEMLAIIISHTRTLAGLANAKGFSKLRDEALLEIEILGNQDPKTGRATPRFEALVKLPGQPLNDRMFVRLEQKPRQQKNLFTSVHNQDCSFPIQPIPNSEYLERAWGMEFDLGQKTSQDSLADGKDKNASLRDGESLSVSQDNVSGFVWTVRRCHEFYPNVTPEQLFESVSVAAESGESVRNIIKNILKCYGGNDHKTRSYSQHGQTLLRWLIANYDNGSIAALPEIQKFLSNE